MCCFMNHVPSAQDQVLRFLKFRHLDFLGKVIVFAVFLVFLARSSSTQFVSLDKTICFVSIAPSRRTPTPKGQQRQEVYTGSPANAVFYAEVAALDCGALSPASQLPS